jgi:hypothetical protein
MKKLNLSREQIVTEFAKIQYQNYLSNLPFDIDSAFDNSNALFDVYLKFLNQANALYDSYKPYLEDFVSDTIIN